MRLVAVVISRDDATPRQASASAKSRWSIFWESTVWIDPISLDSRVRLNYSRGYARSILLTFVRSASCSDETPITIKDVNRAIKTQFDEHSSQTASKPSAKTDGRLTFTTREFATLFANVSNDITILDARTSNNDESETTREDTRDNSLHLFFSCSR